jgi:hypothetical protein
MFPLIQVLLDAAVLAIVLTFAGIPNLLENFLRPVTVVLLAVLVGAITGMLLGPILWGIPRLLISIFTLYFLIGYFFELPTNKKWAVVGAYFVIRLLIGLIWI